MNTGIFLGATATVAITLAAISPVEEFDLISRLVDFGMTGVVIYFGGKELIKAINGVGGRIDKLNDRISELHTDVAKLEVLLYSFRKQSSFPHNHIADDSSDL